MKDVSFINIPFTPAPESRLKQFISRCLSRQKPKIENTKTTMKEYRVEVGDMPIIREMFNGVIFRRIENGYGYVRCTEKDKEFIENSGNHIDLEEV